MGIQAQQVLERALSICVGAPLPVFVVSRTFAALLGLAAATGGVGNSVGAEPQSLNRYERNPSSMTSITDPGHTHALTVPDGIEAIARTLPVAAATMMREEAKSGRIVSRDQALSLGEEWLRRREEQRAVHFKAYCEALDRSHGEGYAKSIAVLRCN